LLDLAARAKIDKDNEAYADAWKDIEHFNKAVPELRIVPAQIMKSVKQRIKTSGKMADGFLADRKLKKYTDKFNYTTTEE
jgi:nitrate/TMAO reductase-like tetraheme cytochrome c subunit